MNAKRAVAKQLAKGNARDRMLSRQISRGRVVPGSALDMAIRLSAGVMKDAGGGGDGGTDGPMTADQVYTPTPRDRRGVRRSRLGYNIDNE